MNISALSFLGINNNSKKISNNPHFGIKLKNQINKDTVSFSGNTLFTTSPFKDENNEARLFEGLRISESVRHALENNEDEMALNILGYKTHSDKHGNITIEESYNASPKPSRRKKALSLNELNINENRLLKNVTKIEGSASFLKGFQPDHYIEVDNVKSDSITEQTRIKKELTKLNPHFITFANKIKEAHQNNDNLNTLKLMGHKVSKDTDDKIIVRDNLTFDFPITLGNMATYIDFREVGIDENKILADIKEIKGNLHIPEHVNIKLPKGIKVGGKVFVSPKEREKEVFSNYKTAENAFAPYKKMPESIINTYISQGIIKPNITTTNKRIYFDELEEGTKKFLEHISENKDTILTSQEIQDKYCVGKATINRKLREKQLVPYMIQGVEYNYFTNSNEYLFDIKDKRNEEALLAFKTKRAINSRKKELEEESNSDFALACIRNSKNFENVSTKSFPVQYLEKLGYGTKADLAANCGLRTNARAAKKYILSHNNYDISTPTMMDILANAKASNPSVINIKKLLKQLGENQEIFKQAVIDNKLNIITDNPYRLTRMNDYCIDIADKKNYAFLKTIQDKDFQNWLQEKVEAKQAYTKKNEQELQDFLNSKELSRLEEREKIQEKVAKINKERALAEKERAIEAKKAISLRSTVAWVLCPNTKVIMSENMNASTREVLNRRRELNVIKRKLVLGNITYEQAQEQIRELNLTKDEEILALTYYKKCWDVASSQEWKDAQSSAKEIIKVYKKEGLDGIENPELKEKLAQWEKIWGKP